MTIAELIAAYKSGELTSPLMIDNDDTSVSQPNGDPDDDATEWQDVFEMHPQELLEALLDHVGIPHESV